MLGRSHPDECHQQLPGLYAFSGYQTSQPCLSKNVQESIDICKAAGYDLIIVETSGIGQSDTEITEHCDVSLYVMTPEFGAATQLEKIDMLDFADLVAINKFDKRGALDALRDVRKQYRRNHNLFDAAEDHIPVYGTMASQFNDPGMNNLFTALMKKIKDKTGIDFQADVSLTWSNQRKYTLFHQTESGTWQRLQNPARPIMNG